MRRALCDDLPTVSGSKSSMVFAGWQLPACAPNRYYTDCSHLFPASFTAEDMFKFQRLQEACETLPLVRLSRTSVCLRARLTSSWCAGARARDCGLGAVPYNLERLNGPLSRLRCRLKLVTQ